MIGIPLGIQIMANLLICYYKNKRVRRVKKVDLTEPGDNAFKFTDNITATKMAVSLSVVIKKYIFRSLNSRKEIQDTLRSHFWTFLST